MNCPTCGAALTAADLEQPACHYCGTVHPHIARAAEKVEVVKQLLAPGPGGVPAALQGMLQGIPMVQGQHVQGARGPVVVMSSVVMSSVVVQGGVVQPPHGAYGAMGQPGMVELQPVGDTGRRLRNVTLVITLVSLGVLLALLALGAVVFFIVAR